MIYNSIVWIPIEMILFGLAVLKQQSSLAFLGCRILREFVLRMFQWDEKVRINEIKHLINDLNLDCFDAHNIIWIIL